MPLKPPLQTHTFPKPAVRALLRSPFISIARWSPGKQVLQGKDQPAAPEEVLYLALAHDQGKRWCELQLSIMVLPCWDVMEEPLIAAWRKGRQRWAPAPSPFTLIVLLGAPQHPHHGSLQSPAHCTMQKKVTFSLSIRLSLPAHVPFVPP